LFVPGEFHDRLVVLSFVEDGGMVKRACVELAAAAICTDGSEDFVFAAERYIVDFLVMCDKLCEDGLLLEVPDGASGVDGCRAKEVW
jgi:hypothetical protein